MLSRAAVSGGKVRGDLRAAAQALADGPVAGRACCEWHLNRIRATEPAIKAWASLDEERALAIAAQRDADRAAGKTPGPLHGLPVGVKDIFDTADLPTEMGSPAFAGHRPARNAELVERILAAGGYALGKTATTEFAY